MIEKEINMDENIQEEAINLTQEEELMIKIQEADVVLERYEDIPQEDMDEETYLKMKELKQEISLMRKELKSLNKKNKVESSLWEKVNFGYISYALVAFLMLIWPLGPIVSVHYLDLLSFILKEVSDVNSQLFQDIVFYSLYGSYFLIFIIIDLVIYRFIKKNKINFWTMIVILSGHILAAVSSIIIVLTTIK